MNSKPNFENLLSVINCEVPARPTLFEFFLNQELYEKLVDPETLAMSDELRNERILMKAFQNAGYDYVMLGGSDFHFPSGEVHHEKTKSLNDGTVITDRKSFDTYDWPDPENFDYGKTKKLAAEMPDGMKMIISGPCGVLENAINLVGYDNLCFMLYEDRELARQIFDCIGEREVKHYSMLVGEPFVGALMSNDDWGFNRQTMLSPADMREFVFPWHKKIVSLAHNAGKPAILHSCGFFEEIAEDVIQDIGFDAKHSYEDNIMPVEEFYKKYKGRIAVLGGIDLDFVCKKPPAEIKKRAEGLLDLSAAHGGFALGTGNSVPYYVPHENYFAMISAVTDRR